VARHRYRVRKSRSDVVINLHHIEPRRFLEDAGGVVIERVRDIIERHGKHGVQR